MSILDTVPPFVTAVTNVNVCSYESSVELLVFLVLLPPLLAVSVETLLLLDQVQVVCLLRCERSFSAYLVGFEIVKEPDYPCRDSHSFLEGILL